MNDVIMTVMEQQVPGEIYHSPLSALEVATSLEAYVDDIHGGVNMEGVRHYNEQHGTTISLTQAIAMHLHKYERYLRCSGGAWSRASGYHFSYEKMKKKLVYMSQSTSVTTFDPFTNRSKTILMKPPSDETKTLGVYMSPGNECKQQVILMQSKVTEWIGNIGKKNLPAHYKRISFNTRLCPQLKYALGVV